MNALEVDKNHTIWEKCVLNVKNVRKKEKQSILLITFSKNPQGIVDPFGILEEADVKNPAKMCEKEIRTWIPM